MSHDADGILTPKSGPPTNAEVAHDLALAIAETLTPPAFSLADAIEVLAHTMALLSARREVLVVLEFEDASNQTNDGGNDEDRKEVGEQVSEGAGAAGGTSDQGAT